jgi:hypothetical protein
MSRLSSSKSLSCVSKGGERGIVHYTWGQGKGKVRVGFLGFFRVRFRVRVIPGWELMIVFYKQIFSPP